jgi:hypothetical protein
LADFVTEEVTAKDVEQEEFSSFSASSPPNPHLWQRTMLFFSMMEGEAEINLCSFPSS